MKEEIMTFSQWEKEMEDSFLRLNLAVHYAIWTEISDHERQRLYRSYLTSIKEQVQ